MNSFLHSILGYASVIGQGSMVPDRRLDGMSIAFDMPEGIYVSGKTRLGAVICDDVKVGASCVINPGAVIDTGSKIYPLTSVSGYMYPYTTAE
jgi:carbonic anhydrase/acetyltransferase-like protein (isoleucine patch superfamily)